VDYSDAFDTPPQLVLQVRPVYPDRARRAELEGVVLVNAGIDTTGRVAEAEVVRGITMLDEAAVACVAQWRFRPARRQGVPVAVHIVVPVRFTLSGD
jgi:protein TonB